MSYIKEWENMLIISLREQLYNTGYFPAELHHVMAQYNDKAAIKLLL